MSTEQEKAIIGGAVIEYGEIKRRLATLEQETRNIGRRLEAVGVSFRQPIKSADPSRELDEKIAALPEPAEVAALVSEVKEKLRRKAELEAFMKECRLELTS